MPASYSYPTTPTPSQPHWYTNYAHHSPSPATWMPPPNTIPFQQQPPPTHVYGFQNVYQANYLEQFHPTHNEPVAFRVALANTTSASVNLPQPATRTKRKQAANASAEPSAKRGRNATSSARGGSSTTEPAVPGVGPILNPSPTLSSSSSSSTSHPVFQHSAGPIGHLGSLLDDPTDSTAGASDVWYFVRGVTSTARPATLPEPGPADRVSEKQPSKDSFPFLACRVCRNEEWTTWKNTAGQTTTIRKHLKSKHGRYWKDMVILKQLKGYQMMGASSTTLDSEERVREPFTIGGFLERLTRWVTVDDQSVGVVDSKELRELFLFLGTELEDRDIPHRTKLSELITDRFKEEYKKMISEIENSAGRVSFTSDVWSRQNLESYMAVTAHYSVRSATGHVTMKSQLVAFRHIQGSHTGANLGKVFVQILKETNCLHKVSMVTMDNASNNNTLMEQVAAELRELKIPFDIEGNRIRCFPHVINIAVKAGLKHLTVLPWYDPDVDIDDDAFSDVPQALKDDPDYWDALRGDVVAAAQRLVHAIRASGQRREDFEAVIREGNESGWGDTTVILRVVGLLKDVETRWSSTFMMIDRVIELHLAIAKLLQQPKYADIAHHMLSDIQLKVLADIRRFLYIPHVVQQVVSAEKTPTLSLVLPMYEKLIVLLKETAKQMPKLSHAILASVVKLDEYLAMSRKTKIYGLAMYLNPTIKFKWIEENLSPNDYSEVRKNVRAAMLEYQREERKKMAAVAIPTSASRRLYKAPSASHAAIAQAKGYARFSSLVRSVFTPNIATPPDSSSPSTTMTDAEKEEVERRANIEDERIVDEEIRRYELEGIITDDHPDMEDFDLYRFWQAKQTTYRLSWRLALDVLPAQASAVPCERVFSSSKETDTLRRSCLSPVSMEVLQVLKYMFRNDRLSFTEDLVCTEQELSVIDIEPTVVDELLSTGRIDDLLGLLDASWKGWGQSS